MQCVPGETYGMNHLKQHPIMNPGHVCLWVERENRKPAIQQHSAMFSSKVLYEYCDTHLGKAWIPMNSNTLHHLSCI